MPAPDPGDHGHDISRLMLGIVFLAIAIISILTITALMAGPPL
jgi:hypothetical protein